MKVFWRNKLPVATTNLPTFETAFHFDVDGALSRLTV